MGKQQFGGDKECGESRLPLDWRKRVRPSLSLVCQSIVVGRVYCSQVGQSHGHEVGTRLLCLSSAVANSKSSDFTTISA